MPVNYRGLPQDEKIERRVLLRRCYINPRTFHQYRSYFIRAGFEVVDCPPLTSQGKTSADIHMVVDILDALAHDTTFDEFIILSADADFTPVLLRLRKHDCRTMILAIGSSSPAYRSAADHLLDENEFVEKGLGVEEPSGAEVAVRQRPQAQATGAVLQEISERIDEQVGMFGRVQAVELPSIYKEFPAFSKGGDWLGYFSLRSMTEGVVEASRNLKLVDDDPWWVGHTVERENGADGAGEELPTDTEVSEAIRSFVDEVDNPVSLAALADALAKKFGESIRRSRWLRAGSFKQLLERLDLGRLRVSPRMPGYVFDSDRHNDPAFARRSGDEDTVELSEVAVRVSRITDVPCLRQSAYAVLLREIAKEVNESGYHLTRTSKTVRDRCNGKGVSAARSHISFVLKGIVFSGHRFRSDGEEDAFDLGEALVENVLNLCSRAQVDLAEEEEDEIHDWILGGLEEDEGDGDFEDSDFVDGNTVDGDTVDGNTVDGNTVDSDSEDGDSEDGDSEDGDSEDGDSEDGGEKDGGEEDGDGQDDADFLENGPPGDDDPHYIPPD